MFFLTVSEVSEEVPPVGVEPAPKEDVCHVPDDKDGDTVEELTANQHDDVATVAVAPGVVV